MKNKKTITKEYVVVESITCDICKKTHAGPGWGGSFEIQDTVVNIRTGVMYPEGGGGLELSYDICPDCFGGKLIPWLAELGANPTSRNWEA